jgi:hypothetical protein
MLTRDTDTGTLFYQRGIAYMVLSLLALEIAGELDLRYALPSSLAPELAR